MPNRDTVLSLSYHELMMIGEALLQSAKDGDTVYVMIQEDGLKFKQNYGIWTPPFGTVIEG